MTSGIIQRDFLGRLNGSRRHPSALRMAPMIDMIFLLLIFFLVAAKFRPEEDFLPFQPASVQAQDFSIGKPEPLQIYITAAESGCKVTIGQTDSLQIENKQMKAHLASMMEKLNDCLSAQKRLAGDPIEIICGPDVKWEQLAKIYNVLFGMGLTDITFLMTE